MKRTRLDHRPTEQCFFLPTILIFVLFSSILCHKSQTSAPRLNVILIVVDALRADHLGCYGYPLDTTPFIDKLAKNALVGDKIYSQSNWTGASMASLMSGTYPAVHKISKSPEDGQDRYSVLPKTLEILPEAFQRKGYFTAAITSCGWVSPNSGYGKGFTDFHLVDRDDEIIFRKTLELLRNRKEEAPFFFYLHLLDTHDYFDLNKEAPSFSGRTFRLSEAMKELKQKPRAEIYGWLGSAHKDGDLSAEDIAYLQDRYDSCLNRTDRLIGELIGSLDKDKVLDQTILIVTADHGESFFEHKRFIHGGDSLYNEVLHVPFIIHNRKLFSQQKRVGRQGQSIDIFPTILDLMKSGGIKIADPSQLQGESLLSVRNNEIVLSENATQDKMKLIYQDWSFIRDKMSGDVELYNLASDPHETNNIAVDNSIATKKLERILARTINESLELSRKILPEDAPIDENTKKALKSLGYIK